MEKIIGITFTMILGLVFLLIGRFFLVKDKKLKNKGGKSTAKIIEKKVGSRNRLYITLEYAADGELIRKKMVTSRFFYVFNEGDEVNIFYDRDKPKSFCFENDVRYIVISIIFFFAGGMELLVVVLSFFNE